MSAVKLQYLYTVFAALLSMLLRFVLQPVVLASAASYTMPRLCAVLMQQVCALLILCYRKLFGRSLSVRFMMPTPSNQTIHPAANVSIPGLESTETPAATTAAASAQSSASQARADSKLDDKVAALRLKLRKTTTTAAAGASSTDTSSSSNSSSSKRSA